MEDTALEIKETHILEEIKDLITEGEFAARDILIQTYYKVGRMIIENNLMAQHVANYISRSERLVEYMVKFASDSKALDKISKEESWTSIIRNKLTTPKGIEDHIHTPITICSKCRTRL